MASIDPLQDLVVGYPKLSGKMEVLPEMAIFRRFGALNAQNTLYLQAELVWLEKQLRQRQVADSLDPQGRRDQYGLNWYRLSQSEDDNDTRQLELVLKIRETLKEYNHALIQQSKILKLPEPDQWDLTHIQAFLQTRQMGPLALTGPDATVWGSMADPKSHAPDLVALRSRPKEDFFSSWVTENAIINLVRCGCARFKKPSAKYGAVGYEDTTILKITYWITSILASLIPITSIIILYCVRSMAARLAVIAGFNILISVCLIAFTNAKRAEVFAVTATFAAVQVVFVGTDKTPSVTV